MGLEPEAGEPELRAPMRKRDVVDPALGDVRPDVHVQVVRSADQGAGALAGAGFPARIRRHARTLISRRRRETRQDRRARRGDPRLDTESDEQVTRSLHLVGPACRVPG